MIADTLAELLRHGPVIGSLSARPCPSWVTDGWYSNNAGAQKLAISRWNDPVTTAAERETAFREVIASESSACIACGRFAFARPKLCFWCRRQ